jgi:equilibrative nucleoside transporter 1/2/3
MTANLILFIITTRVKEIPARCVSFSSSPLFSPSSGLLEFLCRLLLSLLSLLALLLSSLLRLLTLLCRSLFFGFLIVSAVVLAASASLLQNGVVALSASFGPSYLNQIMSGQGAVGFAVACVQFIAAYGAAKNAKNSPSPSSFLLQTPISAAVEPLFVSPPDSVRTSAFVFFLSMGIFAGVSWLSYIVLIHLPLYRLVIRANSEDGTTDASSIKSASSPTNNLKVVERKVRHLGIAMLLVFGVTLSIFPAVTATIQSVKAGEPDARLIQSTALFVPLGFAVFAGGDWMGRVLPQIEKLVWTNWKVLMGCSIARVLFIVRSFCPVFSFLPLQS